MEVKQIGKNLVEEKHKQNCSGGPIIEIFELFNSFDAV